MRPIFIVAIVVLFGVSMASCAGPKPIAVTIVFPDGFRGFGAIYRAGRIPFKKVGDFKLRKSEATIFVGASGGVTANSLLDLLRERGFRIKAYYRSGRSIPLHLLTGDSTEGLLFLIMPAPDSHDIYFFVGTLKEVQATAV